MMRRSPAFYRSVQLPRRGWWLLFLALYGAGVLLSRRLTVDRDFLFLQYLGQSLVELRNGNGWQLQYAICFLLSFFQLLVLYCLGCMPRGCIPAMLLFFIKGVADGVPAAALVSMYGLRGAAVYCCTFWLPEFVCVLCLLYMAVQFWPGKAPRRQGRQDFSRLIGCTFFLAVACGVDSLISRVFFRFVRF